MKSNTLNFIKLSIFFLSTLLFFACSQFSNPSTGSISFSIDSRAARDAKEEAGIDFPVMINIQLHGDYEAVKEEQFPDEPKELIFSFGDLPVGTKIYATAEIYTNISYQKDEKAEPFTEKIIFWESKSDPITVAKGENTINLYFGMPEPIEENKNDEKESKADENEYVDENPVLKANGQAEVEKGTAVVTYRSKEKSVHPEGDGWAAGYWEFDLLADYSKAYITLHAKTEGDTITPYGYKFCIKGYCPANEKNGIIEQHSCEAQEFDFSTSTDSLTIEVNIQNLKAFRDSDGSKIPFSPTAIEFENCSYIENRESTGAGSLIWGDDWSLVVEKIRLVKGGSQTSNTEISITVQPIEETSDFEVNISEEIIEATENLPQRKIKKLTAPTAFESYTWKLNGTVLSDADNEIEIEENDLNHGYNDITLLVKIGDEYLSWNAQIQKE